MEAKRVTIRPEIEMLETLFNRLNDAFFGGELERPMITVAPARKVGRSNLTMGWCSGWRAWAEKPEEVTDTETGEITQVTPEGHYELNICAEFLRYPLLETVDTMTHEMAHLYNALHKVQDTSRGGTYHNKKFKATAEAHGLIVGQSAKYGWNITKPGPEMELFTAEQTDIDILFARTAASEKPAKPAKKPYKYQCPVCGAKFESRKPIHAICDDCTEAARIDDEEADAIRFKCTFDPKAEEEETEGGAE